MVELPVPPPRDRKKRGPAPEKPRLEISDPFDFRVVSHIGPDFNSNDVRHAVIPKNRSEASGLPVAPELPGGSPRPPRKSDVNDGYEVVSRKPAEPYREVAVDVPGSKRSPTKAKPVPINHDYENARTSHSYENTPISKKKTKAPDPPPSSAKPKLSVDTPTGVVFRANSQQSESPVQEAQPLSVVNNTPQRIEPVKPLSIIIQRPDCLAPMALGLDDVVPIVPKSTNTSTGASPRVKDTDIDADLPSAPQAPTSTKASSAASSPGHVYDHIQVLDNLEEWLSSMSEDDYSRVSTIWYKTTGSSRLPDDKRLLKSAVERFEEEERLRQQSPPQPLSTLKKRFPAPKPPSLEMANVISELKAKNLDRGSKDEGEVSKVVEEKVSPLELVYEEEVRTEPEKSLPEPKPIEAVSIGMGTAPVEVAAIGGGARVLQHQFAVEQTSVDELPILEKVTVAGISVDEIAVEAVPTDDDTCSSDSAQTTIERQSEDVELDEEVVPEAVGEVEEEEVRREEQAAVEQPPKPKPRRTIMQNIMNTVTPEEDESADIEDDNGNSKNVIVEPAVVEAPVVEAEDHENDVEIFRL